MRKHYSVKLKERIAELERDLYAIIDGNVELKIKYIILRKTKQDLEKMMYAGISSEGKQHDGIFKLMKFSNEKG